MNKSALKIKILLVLVNWPLTYDADLSSQGTFFYSSPKITVVICHVGFSKNLSTTDTLKVISQVSSQTK